jgi:hypothetical protein
MLIALLALLGVNLIVSVVLLAFVLARKRWVMRRPGAFHGAIRVAGGEIDGLGPKWRRGYGRWVRDVLVWTKAPFLFRNDLMPADALEDQRPARPGEVKRLGDHPVVVRITTGSAAAELAVRDGDGKLVSSSYRGSAETGVAAEPAPMSDP